MASAMSMLQEHALPVVLALLVASGALLKHAWFPAYPLHRIFYPPLGLEQREKVREARDRHRQRHCKRQPGADVHPAK